MLRVPVCGELTPIRQIHRAKHYRQQRRFWYVYILWREDELTNHSFQPFLVSGTGVSDYNNPEHPFESTEQLPIM